jgi:hypothetical protein
MRGDHVTALYHVRYQRHAPRLHRPRAAARRQMVTARPDAGRVNTLWYILLCYVTI